MGIDMQSIVNALNPQQRKWSDICDNMLKQIKAMKPKDRIEYASCISDFVYAITVSMQGWNQWYMAEFNKHFGRKPLSEISKKEFEKLFNTLQCIAIDVLELDKELTQKFEKKSKKQCSCKKKSSKRKVTKKETSYVA